MTAGRIITGRTLVEVILIGCEQIGAGWAYVDVEVVSVE